MTRLLDQTQARVVMLVAAAGYGKTTLARQWLSDKPHAWFGVTPACSDVAALVLGLGQELTGPSSDNFARLREGLRATREPEREVERLVDLFATSFKDEIRRHWIALDDYQALAGSSAAEAFIERIVRTTPARILITSRRRPRWVDARQIVYGEVYEIGQMLLAMDDEEAENLLRHVSSASARGLAALAHGWPAVLGLAAHSNYQNVPSHDLPSALYEFFAEELYQSARPAVRQALVKLALIPKVDSDIATEVLGANASDIVSEGVRLGFLQPTRNNAVEVHPLVREFLNGRSRPVEAPSADEVSRIVALLATRRQWDDAYAVAESAGTTPSLLDLIRLALRPLLDEGRLLTVTHWTEAARKVGLDSPVLDLADAEIAFRRGRDREAEALGREAARRFSADDPLRGRSFYVAGQAARLGDRPVDSAEHFRLAEKFSGSQEDLREALWGQLSAYPGDRPSEEASRVLRKLEKLRPSTANDVLRLASAYEVIDVRSGIGLSRALEAMAAAHPLASRADDPLVVTSFLNAYARCLVMGAYYDDAQDIADEETAAGIKYRLDFVLPPAYTARALAALGRGQFTRASKLLSRSLTLAREQDDAHNQYEISAVRARLLIARRRFHEALAIEPPSTIEGILPGMVGEWLGGKALALVGCDEYDEAKLVAKEAAKIYSLESRALAATAEMLIAINLGATPSHATSAWLERIIQWKYLDVFILAVRAWPHVLELLPLESATTRPALEALRRADATSLIPSMVEAEAGDADVLDGLSKREQEVFELLARGMTNREIGNALYISEVTAKVHVRHILKKLGVRSRTEAALRGTTGRRG